MYYHCVNKEGNNLPLPLQFDTAHGQHPPSLPIHFLTKLSYVLGTQFPFLQPGPGLFGDGEVHVPEASLCMSFKLAPGSHIGPIYLVEVCAVLRDAIDQHPLHPQVESARVVLQQHWL